MPVGFQVTPELDLKCFVVLVKTWRMSASGQITSILGFSHSKKSLTGGFSSVEISYWCWIFGALLAFLIQHPVKNFEKCLLRAEVCK
ncbi:hypothetical protein SLA2020_341840 [Shorea laevis]